MDSSPQLSQRALEEFRNIYEDGFGLRLSDDELQEIALRLLQFFRVLEQAVASPRTRKDTSL